MGVVQTHSGLHRTRLGLYRKECTKGSYKPVFVPPYPKAGPDPSERAATAVSPTPHLIGSRLAVQGG